VMHQLFVSMRFIAFQCPSHRVKGDAADRKVPQVRFAVVCACSNQVKVACWAIPARKSNIAASRYSTPTTTHATEACCELVSHSHTHKLVLGMLHRRAKVLKAANQH